MPLDQSSAAVSDFGWKIALVGGRAVVSVRGEVDIVTAGDLEAAIREQLLEGPVILDLRGVSFMDSCGVNLLDAVLRDADAQGWTLTIGSDLPAGVRQLFDLTGIAEGLPYEDLPDPEKRA